MKFLIAGLGSIGRRHFRNLVALGETDIVLFRTHKATLPDDDLAGYPVETDLVEALEKHKPDGVIIATPTSLHLDVAVPAAKAGCMLLLEKPISNTMDRVDELQAALELGGRQVLVGFQFRFHPNLLRAKQLIAAGEIGRVISAEVHFGEYLPGWHPWEDYRQGYAARADLGGGVIGTQSHSLDYLPWLVGEKVDSVWAFKDKLSDLEVDVEDTVKVGIRFQGGALGSFHLDFNQQPPEHTFKVVGTQGTIKWSLADEVLKVYRAEKKAWDEYPVPAAFERNSMFLEEMRHFIALTAGNTDSLCPLEDGIQVMQLISAIHQSSDQSQMVSL
ncbi:MAG: Gfo/Idh/MocA family oxidoreductase [Anaerolineales bacterium]|nr:Gfo/Idh/MocA family oxidoreductase [Anaerolineales bacterium]